MKFKILAGVDEAGRGCVLGPLVIAVCVINEKDVPFFKEMGIKDSKLLTKKKREELFTVIVERAIEYRIISTSASELDILMNRYSLNEIEARKIGDLLTILKTKIDVLVVDSPDTTPKRFKERIINYLNLIKCNRYIDTQIKSEHYADKNHIEVACASILAKVTRDKELFDLVKINISGYSSDEETIKFLKEYILKHKQLPSYARKKWKTIDNIFQELYQKKIGWFNEGNSK